MNDETFKNLLAFAAANVDRLSWIISYFRPKDLEQGRLVIPKELFQNELRSMLLEKFKPHATNFEIDFSGGAIHLTADAQIDILGPVTARYMLQVEEFVFNAESRRVMFRYYEDLKSKGNYMQQAAIRTASLKGSYLKTLLSMRPVDGLLADNLTISVDLTKMPFTDKIPPQIRLGYVAAENGALKLNFKWEEKETGLVAEKDAISRGKQVQGGYIKGLMNYSDRF
ncbi:MAG: hypothetical protein K6F52_06930 [Clostridia bacterium]|nr:hypothetical protein [Clostridia bacterium]